MNGLNFEVYNYILILNALLKWSAFFCLKIFYMRGDEVVSDFKSGKRTRDLQINFRVSGAEKDMILARMSQVGMENMGAYLRKTAIDGYVVQLDTSDIKELVRVLRITSNSLNQLTKRANETGNVYSDDIEDLRQSYDKMWSMAENIMLRLATI